MPPRSPDKAEKSAGEYGREAVSHFADAARFGARALAERKRAKNASAGLEGGLNGLKEALPSADQAESQLGDLADAGLAKLGKTGKLASKVGVGRRVVKRLMPEDLLPAGEESGGGDGERSHAGAEADDDHLFDDSAPMPIQESIDVAVPVAAVFELCTRFEELPRFSDRIDDVEIDDDTHFALVAKIGRGHRELPIEVVNLEPEERLDWECEEGYEHAGVASFHPLAPRLTRFELTIEPASEGVVERALRLAGIPERAIRQELRRFKAYAELWDEANDYRSADFKDPGSEAQEEEEELEPAGQS